MPYVEAMLRRPEESIILKGIVSILLTAKLSGHLLFHLISHLLILVVKRRILRKVNLITIPAYTLKTKFKVIIRVIHSDF